MAYRLMIGEKSPVIRTWMEMTFPPEEFILQFFPNGHELRRAIQKSPPDVVLCRLSLPGQDGYQLAEWFQEEDLTSKTGLILYKGPFEELNQEKASSVSIDKVIDLPISSLELLSLVRHLLEDQPIPDELPEEPEENPVEEKIEISRTDEIKRLLGEEMVAMERELEKRIGARLKAELMKWLESRLTRRKEE